MSFHPALRLSCRLATTLLAVLLVSRVVSAQPAQPDTRLGSRADEQPSDQRRYLINVRRNQILLQEARSELERVQRLADQGLVSRTEVERAQGAYARTELTYQESLLTLLDVQPRITVARALKTQTRDGQHLVELTLVNETPGINDDDLKMLTAGNVTTIPIPDSFRTRTVRDVFVSLKGTGEGTTLREGARRGTTVALPYEMHIPLLHYSEKRTLIFRLIRDVDSIVAAIGFAGQTREIDVQLEQAETDQALNLSSTQISQEADLGAQATFELRLERSGVDEKSYLLRAVNLPPEVSTSFLDPSAGDARLSQISFPAGVTERKLSLRVFLPERPSAALPTDRPLTFWVLALSPDKAGAFEQPRTYTVGDIDASHAGRVQLELIPRGVGRITVDAPTLFTEIDKGSSALLYLSLRNSGTRGLQDVGVQIEAPAGWRATVSPATLPELKVGEQRQVTLEARPPIEVPVGDYEIRIHTESMAYNRRVPAEDKIFRVSIRGGSSGLATAGLVGLVGLLLAGMAVVVVRATKR